ncbi:MAG: hypothetical protein ACI82F_002683 [Planctomycetota bacterium]|jgi:hypothetical protein
MANDLIKDYVAARKALHQEQARITQRLAEIDQVLGSSDEAPEVKSAPATKAAGPGRRGRGGNKLTMKEAVIQVLQGAALKKAEILDALAASGYKFSTKNPANSLGVLLYGNKQLIKNTKGVFSLAKGAAAPAKSPGPAKKRTMSPEGRARIAAAQKARWAQLKKAKPATAAKAAPVKDAAPKKKKRTMSPEARAKIAAAAKKRWAKVKRAAKKG